MRRITLFIGVLLVFNFCQAQKLNKVYLGLSSDSLHIGHRLEFKSNSTVEISSFPRHMSVQFKLVLNYRRSDDGTISIGKSGISREDSLSLMNWGFGQFVNGTALSIEDKALLDLSNNMIYVLSSDFEHKYFHYYIIDNKLYKQKAALTNSYGLVVKPFPNNKRLKRRMKSIKENLNDYTIVFHRGLDAYKKFGYDAVMGVTEISKRN